MDDPRVPLLLRQLALAYDQRSWHGPNLRGSLRGLSLDAACFRPQPQRHNAWEVSVHCAYWKYRVCRSLLENPPRSFPLKGSDWFARPAEKSERMWKRDLALLDEWHERLGAAVDALDPERLDGRAGNSEFTILELISGAVAHDLYHAGQIRLLRRMHEGSALQADAVTAPQQATPA